MANLQHLEVTKECAVAEFKFSRRRINEIVSAVGVLENLAQFALKPDTERQLRELTKLRIDGTYDYDAEAQRAVWQIAYRTAPETTTGRKVVSASHIKSVAEVLTNIVRDGGLDDGSGIVKPLGELIHASVIEETHERMLQRKLLASGEEQGRTSATQAPPRRQR